MSWIVLNMNTQQQVGEHKTKKKAVGEANQMQSAHDKIAALHDGQAIKFEVLKSENSVNQPEAD